MNRTLEVILLLAATALTISVVPLNAQTSGPSGIQGVESDQFSNVMKINGAKEFDNPFGGIFKTWSLRSFVSKTDGTIVHKLYVSLSLPGRKKGFDHANDDTAKSLNVKKTKSKSKIEDLWIDLGDKDLRAHAKAGYAIKISAKSGDSFILLVTPNQIAAQLDTLQRCLAFLHTKGKVATGGQRPHLLDRQKLGFKASEITDELAAKTGLRKGPGIVVFEVTKGSIADASGLRVLDRIMVVRGCGSSMDSQAAFRQCIAKRKDLVYLGMVVDRGGELDTVGMRLYTDGR